MTTKIAVSLPDELVEAARAAVRDGRAPSVSAYVADAMADKARRTSLGELLDDLDRLHGPVPEDVMVVVDRELAAIDQR
jgi:Arc/MetJ-type ribon-helix-helix transcriptional regulator